MAAISARLWTIASALQHLDALGQRAKGCCNPRIRVSPHGSGHAHGAAGLSGTGANLGQNGLSRNGYGIIIITLTITITIIIVIIIMIIIISLTYSSLWMSTRLQFSQGVWQMLYRAGRCGAR